MATVYLGLGSNVGERRKNIFTAIKHLQQNQVAVTKLSRIIETEPVGGPPQSKYLNAVIEGQTPLSPQHLLSLTKAIQYVMGRKHSVRNGPRIIDIDILLYDNLKIRSPQLTIPHPRMRERTFVMNPLLEIAPDVARKVLYAYHY